MPSHSQLTVGTLKALQLCKNSSFPWQKNKSVWHLTPSQSKPSFPGCWPSTLPAGNFGSFLNGWVVFPNKCQQKYAITNRNYPQDFGGENNPIDLKPTVPVVVWCISELGIREMIHFCRKGLDFGGGFVYWRYLQGHEYSRHPLVMLVPITNTWPFRKFPWRPEKDH